MCDNKRSARKRWKNALLAAALTASVILTLPVWSVGQAEAAPTGKLDLKKPCMLQIERSSNGAKQGKVQVDLYKVADAEKIEGYEAYKLTIPADSPYSSLAADLEAAQKQEDGTELADGANAEYRALAQKVAGVVFTRETKEDQEIWIQNAAVTESSNYMPFTLDLSKANALEGLGAGMYLVVAHGADLSAEQYTTTKDGQIVTMAYSDDSSYVYSYLPELIALPSRGAAPIGSFSTAGPEPWSNKVTVTLKSEEEAVYASLQINKTFMVPAGEVITGGNGCVFQVEAVLNGESVYSGVAEIPYAGRATGTVTVPNVIPVGAAVTVTEVYSGASFTVSGDSVKTIPSAVADQNGVPGNRASFVNTGNGASTGGEIVTNSFIHGEDGWTWNNPKPAQQ